MKERKNERKKERSKMCGWMKGRISMIGKMGKCKCAWENESNDV
jgi:hypothetical protein